MASEGKEVEEEMMLDDEVELEEGDAVEVGDDEETGLEGDGAEWEGEGETGESGGGRARGGGKEGEESDGESEEEDAMVDPSLTRFGPQYSGSDEPVYVVDIHPRLPWAVTGDGDDRVRLWDLTSGEEVVPLVTKAHSDTVVAVQFSHDGTRFASGGLDGKVCIWKTPTEADRVAAQTASDAGEAVTEWGMETSVDGPSGEIEWVAWHPKGPLLLAGSADATVWLFDGRNGDCVSVMAGHEAPVLAGAWSPSGKAVVTGGDDGQLRLWAPKTGATSWQVTPRDGGSLTAVGGWMQDGIVSIAMRGDGTALMGGKDGTARLFNVESQRVLATFSHRALTAAGRADEAGAASGGGDAGAAEVSDTATGAVVTAGAEAEGVEESEDMGVSVEGVGFCDPLPWAATGGTDGSVCLWDLSTMRKRRAWMQEGSIIDLKWVPGEPTFVTAGADGAVRVFDARADSAVRTIPAHSGMTQSIAFWRSPNPPEDELATEPPAAPTRGTPASWCVVSAGDDGTVAVIPLDIPTTIPPAPPAPAPTPAPAPAAPKTAKKKGGKKKK